MSFLSKLSAARTVIQGRAASQGLSVGSGRYANVLAFNQNDEGIWRNGAGGSYAAPGRDDVGRHGPYSLQALMHYSKS